MGIHYLEHEVECEHAVQALAVGGGEEDGGGVDAEEERRAVREVVVAEDLERGEGARKGRGQGARVARQSDRIVAKFTIEDANFIK